MKSKGDLKSSKDLKSKFNSDLTSKLKNDLTSKLTGDLISKSKGGLKSKRRFKSDDDDLTRDDQKDDHNLTKNYL